eukprot:365685-Chlamydomonas_euryale.AAC.5
MPGKEDKKAGNPDQEKKAKKAGDEDQAKKVKAGNPELQRRQRRQGMQKHQRRHGKESNARECSQGKESNARECRHGKESNARECSQGKEGMKGRESKPGKEDKEGREARSCKAVWRPSCRGHGVEVHVWPARVIDVWLERALWMPQLSIPEPSPLWATKGFLSHVCASRLLLEHVAPGGAVSFGLEWS